jgi:hypothetical protein
MGCATTPGQGTSTALLGSRRLANICNHSQRRTRSPALEVDRERRVHCTLCLHGHVPWLDAIALLEAHLEILGTTQGEFFYLARPTGPVLDRGTARCGLQHHPRCLLCDQDPEDMRHLLIERPFSKQIWHETLSWLRMTCRILSNNKATLTNWLGEALQATPKPLCKGLGTAALLIPWMI